MTGAPLNLTRYPLLIAFLKGARFLFHALAFPIFLLFFILLSIAVRIRRNIAPIHSPRILWGPTAIGGTQYYNQACRLLGYESATLMYGCSFINRRDDFDYYPETLFPRLAKSPVFRLFFPYLCAAWALPKYEIHFQNFDGGLLRGTALKYLENDLWHLAGGKKIVYCYGGDAQILSRFHDLTTKNALMRDYPQLARNEKETVKRVRHYTKTADYIFASGESVDYLPYWNDLMMQLSAFDTDTVSPSRVSEGNLRERFPGKKIILHAPNHRNIKGTGLLIKACEILKREGRTDFELIICEKQPNDKVLSAIRDSDIVADQFIMGYYAMFALEGMALEKPVLCYLRPDLYELYSHYSWARECPVVNTPRNLIKERLIYLLDDENERLRLGKLGRAFVEKYHSLAAMGKRYDRMIRSVWPHGG